MCAGIKGEAPGNAPVLTHVKENAVRIVYHVGIARERIAEGPSMSTAKLKDTPDETNDERTAAILGFETGEYPY